jgi:hypothetical protein
MNYPEATKGSWRDGGYQSAGATSREGRSVATDVGWFASWLDRLITFESKGIEGLQLKCRSWWRSRMETCIARVFRSDSPGKVAQWLARSIRESWGVLWLVIRLLSVQADVPSSVIKSFFLLLHSTLHLPACWISPHHYPYFSYSASEECHV